MRGKKAKAIRKEVYGVEYSPRFREYQRHTGTSMIYADQKRRIYQKLKKESQK